VIKLGLLLFLKGNGDIGIGGEANLVAFYGCDQAPGHIVMMAFMSSFATVLLREFDPVSFNTVNRSHMHSIGADYFGVFFDL
jgi:hypothetical protein